MYPAICDIGFCQICDVCKINAATQITENKYVFTKLDILPFTNVINFFSEFQYFCLGYCPFLCFRIELVDFIFVKGIIRFTGAFSFYSFIVCTTADTAL